MQSIALAVNLVISLNRQIHFGADSRSALNITAYYGTLNLINLKNLYNVKQDQKRIV